MTNGEYMSKRWRDPEYRTEMSEVHRQIWADPETRDKMVTAIRKTTQSPAFKARQKRLMTQICGRKVLCVETGKVYDSVTMAAADVYVHSTAITQCAQGKCKTSAGYHWKYVGKSPINHTPSKVGKKIMCVETGKVYISTQSAADDVYIHKAGISQCINGHRETAGGYHWRVVED